MVGPSLARNPRLFVETFGTQRELLRETDERIEELERAA
jgi:hypothetical protein